MGNAVVIVLDAKEVGLLDSLQQFGSLSSRKSVGTYFSED